MKIAVDFDGTIVEHEFPKIGKPMLFAFETLKELQKDHQLILWTFRSGDLLNDAVEFCKENGIEFYAVNKSYPEEEFDFTRDSRKVDADLFIDDRNVGGLPGWGEIYQMINNKGFGDVDHEINMVNRNAGKLSFFKRLFS